MISRVTLLSPKDTAVVDLLKALPQDARNLQREHFDLGTTRVSRATLIYAAGAIAPRRRHNGLTGDRRPKRRGLAARA